jgi:hypothetical protein
MEADLKLLKLEDLRTLLRINKNKSYTYVLHKNDGTPFYVGVGIRHRVLRHTSKWEICNGHNILKNNIVKQEIENFGEILYSIIIFHTDREICLNHEMKLIAKFGRYENSGILANWTDGGEIGPKGYKFSEERKQRQSVIGQLNAEKISSTLKDFWASMTEDERKLKVAHLDKTRNSEKTREIVGKASLERWANPEYKSRLAEKQKISQAAVAHIHSDNMKNKWADPEFREYMIRCRAEKRALKLKLKELQPCNS